MLNRRPLLLASMIGLYCLAVQEKSIAFGADQPVGPRPYEMEWAGRDCDTRPPNVDFEQVDGWTVECHDAVADFERSREQQLWGRYVGKLTYHAEGRKPVVTVRPAQPLPVPADWDCVNLWVYGNNWAFSPDRSTPPVTVNLLFRSAAGSPLRINMGTARWKEWWLMHWRLSPEQAGVIGDGTTWEGLEITNGRNQEDRTLYFDNLSFYREPLPPLTFDPRPRRGVDPFPGQSVGTNTGPGQLPFPNRPETILPDNLADRFETSVQKDGEMYAFIYHGSDGRLIYRYLPESGTLDDVTAEWSADDSSVQFRPMVEGGVYFQRADGGPMLPPEGAKLLACERRDDALITRWQYRWDGQSAEVTYTFRLWQKSLVIDVACVGGMVEEVHFGRAAGLEDARLVTLPFLVGGSQRPAVLVSGPPAQPLFTMGMVDHTRSNASELWFANETDEPGATYNGGSRYLPKTDGRRNDCFERLFLTISPRFEEVLPNIPNPKSPWMHVAGERVWRAHGASDRERDYATWKRTARYGMNKIALTDHETGWRDGGESFTFRTRAAPGKGGDDSHADYARKIRALGFRYGIYNNYTDFAAVNEHWHEDMVTRLPNGQWQAAWPRCYNPKPARAVEYEARLAPIIQEKFHLDTAYCDVHTAVQPWRYCDFDARVPGAGTFAATFYAYGEIMLHQKQTWNGPVYSEGNNHWYYCGLTDGNYGQDQLARLNEKPWLVDFDLRKMHPLCCNFGMGNPGMFFGRNEQFGRTPDEQERRLDQFLAGTLAFGHTGFLVTQGGIRNTLRSYFGLQQVHARYAQAVAADIRYADADGNLLDSSAAVATGAFRRSQIATRYDNGLEVTVNGHDDHTWTTKDAELPPFGWFVRDTRAGDLLAFSALVDGHRADYVDSPAYLYADPRGRFVRFEKLACDGPLVAHHRNNGDVEVIPVAPCTRFGVSLGGRTATAVALEEEGGEVGTAVTRFSRGLVYIEPVTGAFSYRLTPGKAVESALQSDRIEVVPGETVTVVGRKKHTCQIPGDAVTGEQIWRESEDAWIDFLVRPLVDADLELDEGLRLKMTSGAASAADADIAFDGHRRKIHLTPGQAEIAEFPFAMPDDESVRKLSLDVQIDQLKMHRDWWLKCEESVRGMGELTAELLSGQRFRGRDETALDGVSGAHTYWDELTCGDKTQPGLFMHPPYRGGAGYTYALFRPYSLPPDVPAVFRCEIGKRDGSDPGDGILFRVAVVDKGGTETVVAERQWIDHAWTKLDADLSRWAGQQVHVKLLADVGPKDNSSGDWACWTAMRLESARQVLTASIHDEPVQLCHQHGPFPPGRYTDDQLRAAKRAVLHYQGIGFDSSGEYVSYGQLNGVSLGTMPGAGGSERDGIWSDALLPLSSEAIGKLGTDNVFVLDNRGRDWFKMGRAWIELEMPDGRKLSSQVNTTVFTQPPEWPYAEGTRVPFSESITIPLRFRARK